MTDDGAGPPATGRRSGGPCPAYARYADGEHARGDADLLVLADHPDRPAVQRR